MLHATILVVSTISVIKRALPWRWRSKLSTTIVAYLSGWLDRGTVGRSDRMRLMINAPPVGTCRITPDDGVSLVTYFYVICNDVVDENTPLNYSLYVNYSSVALQTWTWPVFQPFTLESGSEADDYWVNITVIITDSFDDPLTIQLAVQVFGQPTTDVTTAELTQHSCYLSS